MIVRPSKLKGRCLMKGEGMGIVTALPSSGSAGTFTSYAPSPGVPNLSTGGALSKALASKLEQLKVVQKHKPSNIKFSI